MAPPAASPKVVALGVALVAARDEAPAPPASAAWLATRAAAACGAADARFLAAQTAAALRPGAPRLTGSGDAFRLLSAAPFGDAGLLKAAAATPSPGAARWVRAALPALDDGRDASARSVVAALDAALSLSTANAADEACVLECAAAVLGRPSCAAVAPTPTVDAVRFAARIFLR